MKIKRNFSISALTSVFGQAPGIGERYLGHTGVLTCNYTPPNAGYISVEWKYSATGSVWNTANRVYSYLSPGTTGTGAGHLTNRSNHTHESEQIKLFIYDLQDTEGGNYFCQIVGGNTLRDNVTLYPISEYMISMQNKPRKYSAIASEIFQLKNMYSMIT